MPKRLSPAPGAACDRPVDARLDRHPAVLDVEQHAGRQVELRRLAPDLDIEEARAVVEPERPLGIGAVDSSRGRHAGHRDVEDDGCVLEPRATTP
jgi:hypothetical protein